MQRPVIGKYQDPVEFVKDMIAFRKATESDFSVSAHSKRLRRLSPTLVTLVVQRRRKLSIDRVDEFGKLLNLNASERFFFRNWLVSDEAKSRPSSSPGIEQASTRSSRGRKLASATFLRDWINVYVKDFFQLESVQSDPELLHVLLAPFASRKRIEKALRFLLHEGYLRRTLKGGIVLDTELVVADTSVPGRLIRQFHKGALSIAQRAIDIFAPSERYANTMTIPLDAKGYAELAALIEEFGERLKDFAEHRQGRGERLYQVIINASPVGASAPGGNVE
jgi:uncharacterized protein (TIGR02147 family)